jgi:hypothetical protein
MSFTIIWKSAISLTSFSWIKYQISLISTYPIWKGVTYYLLITIYTVNASNFGPNGYFRPFRARPVASLGNFLRQKRTKPTLQIKRLSTPVIQLFFLQEAFDNTKPIWKKKGPTFSWCPQLEALTVRLNLQYRYHFFGFNLIRETKTIGLCSHLDEMIEILDEILNLSLSTISFRNTFLLPWSFNAQRWKRQYRVT